MLIADGDLTGRDLYDLAHLFGGVTPTIAIFMLVGAGIGWLIADRWDGVPAAWLMTIGALVAFVLIAGSAGVGKPPQTAEPCKFSPTSCQLPTFLPTFPTFPLQPTP